jgi:uncharacterized membrane protein
VPPLSFAAGALVIQLVAALVIAGHVARALVSLHQTGCIPLARLHVADGVIAGLGLLTAATLLKTIELHTWAQIGLFGVVLSLRIGLKRFFGWERGRILAREPALRSFDPR